VIDLEHADLFELAAEAMSARITSGAENDDLLRPFKSSRHGQLVEDPRANLMQDQGARQASLDIAARQMAHDRQQA
jgi:hypothetical protein